MYKPPCSTCPGCSTGQIRFEDQVQRKEVASKEKYDYDRKIVSDSKQPTETVVVKKGSNVLVDTSVTFGQASDDKVQAQHEKDDSILIDKIISAGSSSCRKGSETDHLGLCEAYNITGNSHKTDSNPSTSKLAARNEVGADLDTSFGNNTIDEIRQHRKFSISCTTTSISNKTFFEQFSERERRHIEHHYYADTTK